MDKLKEITERYTTGYTMARYGTRDAIHQQMSEDIHALIHLVKKLNLQSVSGSASDRYRKALGYISEASFECEIGLEKATNVIEKALRIASGYNIE